MGAEEGRRVGQERHSGLALGRMGDGPAIRRAATRGDGGAIVMAKARPVIVCTEHRGVFFGYATDTTGSTILLSRARMAIKWATTRGVMELAEVGPNSNSRLSARADIDVRKVTAVFEVTPTATAAWEAHQ